MINLYVFPASPRAFKVLAAATHLGLEHNVRLVDLSKGEHRTPEFAALNPNKKMPVLEEDGFVLWESNAILQYLAAKKPESGLLPTDARGRADVTRWQFWDMAHWDPACAILIFETLVKKLLAIGEPPPDDPLDQRHPASLFAAPHLQQPNRNGEFGFLQGKPDQCAKAYPLLRVWRAHRRGRNRACLADVLQPAHLRSMRRTSPGICLLMCPQPKPSRL